jgi:hypothetical protein
MLKTKFGVLSASLLLLACSPAGDPPGGGAGGAGGKGGGGGGGRGGTGGTSGSMGGAGGSTSGGTGGSGGSVGGSGGTTGGSSSSGGVGGTGTGGTGGSSGGTSGSGGSAVDSGASDTSMSAADAPANPSGPIDYGGVGMRVDVPVLYTDTPTPPIVAPECPDDPTQGFTEYKGTFQVQRPHDLAAADRMKYENGIYTFWVNSGDKAHQPGNTTAPRTEARYPNFSGGEQLWSADVMYETVSKTCIMQIHNVNPAIAMYMRVQGDRMFNLSTGKTFLTNYNNKWFNLKVALNTKTLEVRIYINNCLKETSKAPSSGTPDWYFKNGTYTCDSGTCRANFKNLHLYKKE